jgi:hypothetical protein
MSKRYLSFVALLFVVAISLGVRAGLAADDESPSRSGQPFSTALTGAEEVNAQGTPNQGDPDGSGQADLTFNFRPCPLTFTSRRPARTVPSSFRFRPPMPVGCPWDASMRTPTW